MGHVQLQELIALAFAFPSTWIGAATQQTDLPVGSQ